MLLACLPPRLRVLNLRNVGLSDKSIDALLAPCGKNDGEGNDGGGRDGIASLRVLDVANNAGVSNAALLALARKYVARPRAPEALPFSGGEGSLVARPCVVLHVGMFHHCDRDRTTLLGWFIFHVACLFKKV